MEGSVPSFWKKYNTALIIVPWSNFHQFLFFSLLLHAIISVLFIITYHYSECFHFRQIDLFNRKKNVLNKYGQKVQMGRSYIFRISFRCESSVQNDGIIISSLVACLTHAKKLNSSACFSSTCCTKNKLIFIWSRQCWNPLIRE